MAWYKAGSIAISGTAVTGTGTNWSDNKMGIGPGQALLIPAAGTVRMFEILRVDSATHLTLTSDAGTVPAGQVYAIMSFYTDSMPDFARRLSAQLSYYQSQMDGWQQIMTGTGSITLTDPNGMQVTISSFKKLTDDMSGKANKGANSDITSISGLTTALSVAQGGTGAKNAPGARTNLGITDKQLNSVDGKSGGQLSTTSIFTGPDDNGANNRVGMHSLSTNTVGGPIGRSSFQYFNDTGYIGATRGGGYLIQDVRIGIDKADGSWVVWSFDYAGNATANHGSWINSSDRQIKTNIQRIEEPLRKMRMMYGYTWDRLDNAPPGQGFIAQELQKVIPTAVFEGGNTTLNDGTVIEKTLAVDVSGASAALHHEAILALMDKVEELKSEIDKLKHGS